MKEYAAAAAASVCAPAAAKIITYALQNGLISADNN